MWDLNDSIYDHAALGQDITTILHDIFRFSGCSAGDIYAKVNFPNFKTSCIIDDFKRIITVVLFLDNLAASQ